MEVLPGIFLLQKGPQFDLGVCLKLRVHDSTTAAPFRHSSRYLLILASHTSARRPFDRQYIMIDVAEMAATNSKHGFLRASLKITNTARAFRKTNHNSTLCECPNCMLASLPNNQKA
jgi:hypothetical protein